MRIRILFFLLTFLFLCLSATGSSSFIKAHSSQKTQINNTTKNSPVRLSVTASQDDLNVYGTAAFNENSLSNLSYRITVTVTSPSGRMNTTQSDWSAAPLTHTTGLSIGEDDGTFNVQSKVESQSGTYDEYGNFTGTGNIAVVDSANSFTSVAPFVYLRWVGFLTPQGNNVSAGGSATVSARIFASREVPIDTVVSLEINETDMPTAQYTITDLDDNNSLPGVVNRQIRNPGRLLETNLFRINIPASQTQGGRIFSEIRINRAAGVNIGNPQALGFVLNVNPATTAGICRPECFEPNPDCPCFGIFYGSLRRSCGALPEFVKANFSPKPKLTPQCLCSSSPILIDIAGDGFTLTGAADGVPFDFNGDGVIAGKLAWTTADSDDAWLVLDRNENNRIDNGTELFGNATPQPAPPAGQQRHGFLALAAHDGDRDGKITRRDLVFQKLRLWQDKNHNGVSEIEELSSLPALDVVAIFLDYQESKKTDQYGNRFKYRAKVRDKQNARVGRWAWDAFLTSTR